MRTDRRQSKTITIAYASLATIILLIIVAVALVMVPPSPPSVAEFAPQAQEPIKDAPNQQSSQFGSGAGSCAKGQVCGGPDTAALSLPRKVIEKARVRRCVGSPPRQTEDPQSPPCINNWLGNNGGTTSRGITRDEIRIAIPDWGSTDSQHSFVRAASRMARHFNLRYEFYGRTIRPVPFLVVPGDVTPERQRANAERAAEVEPFGALSPWPFDARSLSPFHNELSRQGILSFDTLTKSTSYLQEYAPFQWQYQVTGGELLDNVAEFACNSLVGRLALHGGPDVAVRTRSFAVHYPTTANASRPPIERLSEPLRRCGADLKEASSSSWDGSQARVNVADFKNSGITSIFCLCQANTGGSGMRTLMVEAAQIGYKPEWILTGWSDQDNPIHYGYYIPQQAEQENQMFGVTTKSRLSPLSQEPWVWAATEADPDFYPTGFGGAVAHEVIYRMMLIIASGIQMAGPSLTPQTFQRGLQQTTFPNPAAGAAPHWQASVGFGNADYTMQNDFGLVWWSKSTQVDGQPSSQIGSWCYIDRGARWRLGQWPKREHAFFDRSQPCR